MAVAVRVLARLVDVERVVGVLDERDLQPARDEKRDQLLDQRRLAAARPARESEYLHIRSLPAWSPTNSLGVIIADGGAKIELGNRSHIKDRGRASAVIPIQE